MIDRKVSAEYSGRAEVSKRLYSPRGWLFTGSPTAIMWYSRLANGI
jgi:hypothetical protein